MEPPKNNNTTTYPEFGDLSRSEIQIRLEAFENLINSQMAKEYNEALEEKKWIQKQEILQEIDKKKKNKSKANKKDFWVIAHRGWSGSYPENTLIGLHEAIKLGCHMIEFDVTLTKDRKPIIIHDKTLSRTTNGYGKVHKYMYKDLRKLDAGSWFHPKYAGTPLPSLDEILLISKGSGIMINIEIKKDNWDETLQDDSIERQIIQAIDKYNLVDKIIISSFRWGYIERIHKLAPHIKTALLHYKSTATLNPAKLKKKYGIVSFNPQEIELNKKFVIKCHDVGLKVLPFTINTYTEMEQYILMGVDGMFTNHPNRLFRFFEEQNSRIKELEYREKSENKSDIADAIARLEDEEMDKARKRARWRAKRMLLQVQKARMK